MRSNGEGNQHEIQVCDRGTCDSHGAAARDAGAFSLLFDDKYEVAFSPDDGDGTVVFHADLGDAAALMAPPVASKLNFRYPVNPPFPKPANAAALPKTPAERRQFLVSVADFDPKQFAFMQFGEQNLPPEIANIRTQLAKEADRLQRLTNPLCEKREELHRMMMAGGTFFRPGARFMIQYA